MPFVKWNGFDQFLNEVWMEVKHVGPSHVISFKNKIKLGDGECWEWKASKFRDGYGQFGYKSKNWRAHRFAYMLSYGDFPIDLCVCHKCDNPPCVNPAHLFLGTNADNIRDRHNKGRDGKPIGENNWAHAHPEHFQGERNASSKLKVADILEIRKLRVDGHSFEEISIKFGIARSAVHNIVTRRRWKHV